MTKKAKLVYGQLNILNSRIPSLVKAVIFLTILVIFNSCQQKNNNTNSKSKFKSIPSLKKPKATRTDTILNSISGHVDGHQFFMTCNNGYNLFLLNDKGDTLYQDSVYSPKQEFVDFNADGYKDILVEYMTNVPHMKDLLLYESTEKTYKKVTDLQDFPAAQRIGNTKYFYSYHRSGCADMNWDSDLFYIENYKTIKVGNINGSQCHDRNIKDGIYVNKIVDGKHVEMARFPIKIIDQYKDYKWGFIDEYWQKHYKRFL